MNEITTMAAAQDLSQNGFCLFTQSAQDSVFHEAEGSDAFATQMSAPGSRGLIAYVSPIREIARRMETGASAREALQHWLDAASVCLALARKWRKQLVVFQIPSDTTAEKALQTVLSDRLAGAALPDLARQSEQTKPFFDALAGLEAQKHPGTYAAMSELQARSAGATDAFDSFENCTATIRSAWDQMEKDRRDHDSASHENLALIGLLNGQISQLEEALQETEARVQQQVVSLKSGEARIEALTAQLKSGEAQIEALTVQQNAFYASTSWRVTSPMRASSRLIRK